MAKRSKQKHTGLGNNVGWNVWNMSKRVSSIKGSARQARQLVDDPDTARWWSADGLARLRELATALEGCASEADGVWMRVRTTANGSDPGLVEPATGISVVHNHGEDPATMEKVWAMWHNGNGSIWRGYDLADQLKLLITAEGGHGGEGGQSS